jgi:phosphopantothenoylcysteine decarboxylase/phosphopantothenate--cysteine ligase
MKSKMPKVKSRKNLDLIVLNSLRDDGAGFGESTNKVTFIDKNFNIEPMELKSKEAVADDILNKVIANE